MNGRLVVARREHGCMLCPWPILQGQRYWSEKITPWDHPDNESYSAFKAHPLCHDWWLAGHGWSHDGEFYDGQWVEEIRPLLHRGDCPGGEVHDAGRVSCVYRCDGLVLVDLVNDGAHWVKGRLPDGGHVELRPRATEGEA